MEKFKHALLVAFIAFVSIDGASAATKCGADISIKFTESAPRDFFKISNGSSDWQINSVSINLALSKGKLVFDTEKGGFGVEVFQKFKEEAGSAKAEKPTKVSDGAKTLSVKFLSFKSNRDYQFSIDVDDQLTASDLGNIRVTDSEISGAIVTLNLTNLKGETISQDLTFSGGNKAALKWTSCG